MAPVLVAQTPQPCVVEMFIGDPEYFAGDGGPALDAKFAGRVSMAAASDGTVYVSDSLNYRIRKIDPTATISTAAGTGVPGFDGDGDGGQALQAQLAAPGALAPAPDGSLYFVGGTSNRIRKISPGGVIDTVYVQASSLITGLAVAADGTVYFTEILDRKNASRVNGLYRLENDGSKTTIAGGVGTSSGDGSEGGVPALEYGFQLINGVYVADNGELYVIDRSRVMRIDESGIIHVLVGRLSGRFEDGAPPLETTLFTPHGLVENADGDLYIRDHKFGLFVLRDGVVSWLGLGVVDGISSNESGILFSVRGRISQLDSADVVTPFAGVNQAEFNRVGLPLNQSLVSDVSLMLTDSQGRLYYVLSRGDAVYRTTLGGVTELVAGGGAQPPADGIVATDVELRLVRDIAIDGMDRLYMRVGVGGSLPVLIVRIELDGRLTVLAGGGAVVGEGSPPPQGVAATDLNLSSQSSQFGVTPDGIVYFPWDNFLVERGLDGVVRRTPISTNEHYSIDVDRQGRILLNRTDGLYVYDDVESAPTRYSSGGIVHAATAANGTVFGRGNTLVLRFRPDGRQTTMIPTGVGFETDAGKLLPNSGLFITRAITTNADGDLFVADEVTARIFVIRDADTCVMERPYAIQAVDSASYARRFSPGQLTSVFGDYLGPEVLAIGAPGKSSDNTWQTKVDGFEVLVDGKPAPIIFARSDQAAFIMPNEVGDSARIQYRLNGVESSVQVVEVESATPGIFTADSSGGGQAAALNQDGSVNSSANPASPGSVVVLYITGAGATNPPSQTGSLNTFPLPVLVEEVEAQINGAPTVVEFAGPAPGLVSGVVQINVRVPADTPSGSVPVFITIGGEGTKLGPTDEWPTVAIE